MTKLLKSNARARAGASASASASGGSRAKVKSGDVVDAALRRLAEPKSWARESSDGGLEILVARNRFARPVIRVAAETFANWLALGWVNAQSENSSKWVIAAAGRKYLSGAEQNEYPHRAKHQIVRKRMEVNIDGQSGMLSVNEAETPLGWLLNRKGRDGKPLISREQFEAGERMRRDFTLASLSPRVTAMWGLPVSDRQSGAHNDAANLSDTVIAAKARLWAAFDAAGPGLGTILLQVCCYLNGLEDAERNLSWPARSGKVVLGIALDRLVQHYGLDMTGKPEPRRRVFVANDGVSKKIT